nr:hypothetical protein GCM10020093_018460 [Planobispora longispora]
MALRKITDLDPVFRDVTFADEGRLLALDADADLWHVDLAGGPPLCLGGGEEIAGAALERFEGTCRRCDVTPRRISWHGGSATAVVHIDCGSHWLLLRRASTGPWRPLLTGSRLVCSPSCRGPRTEGSWPSASTGCASCRCADPGTAGTSTPKAGVDALRRAPAVPLRR